MKIIPIHQLTSLNRCFESLILTKGVHYRKVIFDGQARYQLVHLAAYVTDVLKGMHRPTDVGHPGKGKTLSLLHDRFYWPGMSQDVEHWIKKCDRCLRRKPPTNTRASLVSIYSSATRVSMYGFSYGGKFKRRIATYPG